LKCRHELVKWPVLGCIRLGPFGSASIEVFLPASLSRHAYAAAIRPGDIVSKPRSSVAVSQPTLGGFLAALFLGSLCILAAWLMQQGRMHVPKAITRPHVLVELIGKPAILQPSAYD